MRITQFVLAGALTFAFAAPASAHIGLDDPPSRYGQAILKQGPCGMTDGPRSENVTTFEAGQTITVKWNEYINHPGHFRISFDADGDDDFVDPACLSNCDNANMEIETYSNAAVLLDDIADKDGGDYTAEVTLPDVECDNCTLQVIQIMTDKAPYTIGGNDIYYQCADLILTASTTPADMGNPTLDMGTPADMGPPDDMGTTNPTPDMGNGTNDTTDMGGEADAYDYPLGDDNSKDGCCSTIRPAPAAAAWLGFACLGLMGLRRRRRD